MNSAPAPSQPDRAVPRATYRLQFNEHFRLSDALALVPYLHDLGISHLYASPLFAAQPHSSHGYDVCDFSRLNPELGTDADFQQLVAALRERGMGLVLDIVPNHMGVGGPENHWWWDVLTNGRESRYAGCFDIDWNSPNPRLRGKVLVPILADPYDQVLKRGEIRLLNEGGALVLGYFEHRLPLAPNSVPANQSTETALTLDAGALDQLIQRQHYLLTHWQQGDADLNYRRFFAIPTLAALRTEDEAVFNGVHERLREFAQKGWVDGLRVDHPDGLRDPEQYLQRLRALAPGAWIIVEKILAADESLPAAWPVAGTTGYDFLNQAGGLFIDPAGEKPLTDFYAAFTAEKTDYAALVIKEKRLVLHELLGAEVNRLTEILAVLAARDARDRNFQRDELRAAMMELAACIPVYRTYLRPGSAPAPGADTARVKQATNRACRQRPDLAPELFIFLSDLLLMNEAGGLEGEFVCRFQQLTGPAMAKGVEDTVFYRFNRLTALNEVGGDPGRFGLSVEAFHQACRVRRSQWPHSMLASSTHDTKRGEDVRARLCLLSEIPEIWTRAVRRWSAMNERHRRQGLLDRNAEYLFYQTLFGAWPLSVERAVTYMEKAVREARQHTNWARPNQAYEKALREFIIAAMENAEFLEDVAAFLRPLVDAGLTNSLAQTLVKLTAPGVPDVYQGAELWDFSLVDPDNRRPVNFEPRRRLLEEMDYLTPEKAWRHRAEGVPKLWLIRRTLELRARRPELFSGGGYEALYARGSRAENLVAFSRGGAAVTIVPRLMLDWDQDWTDTVIDLPGGLWRNVITGEGVMAGPAPIATLLRRFPVALLAKTEDD